MERSAFVREKHKRWFALLDVDGNGVVNDDDLHIFADKLSERIRAQGAPDEIVSNVISRVKEFWNLPFGDAKNHKGDVHFEAFEAQLDKRFQSMTQEERMASSLEINRHLFECIDFNSDNMITKDELACYYGAYGLSHEDAIFAFNMIDQNQDGVISFEEFLKSRQEYMMSSDPSSQGNHHFGKLSPEILALASQTA